MKRIALKANITKITELFGRDSGLVRLTCFVRSLDGHLLIEVFLVNVERIVRILSMFCYGVLWDNLLAGKFLFLLFSILLTNVNWWVIFFILWISMKCSVPVILFLLFWCWALLAVFRMSFILHALFLLSFFVSFFVFLARHNKLIINFS